MTLLPGSCGEFLQRLPSSKRLLFTENSGCRGFPTFTWGKGQTHKSIYQEPSDNQQAFTDSSSLQARLGAAGKGQEEAAQVLSFKGQGPRGSRG